MSEPRSRGSEGSGSAGPAATGESADLGGVELRLLRYFVAVAEELHFGRAARRLHMSQPPLSNAIRSLESRLGTTLLTRDSRNVALTEMGEMLLARARDLIELHESMLTDLAALRRRDRGRVLILFSVAHAGLHLSNLLRQCSTVVSGLTIEVTRAAWMPDCSAIAEGAADVALVGEPLQLSSELDSMVLADYPSVLIVPATHHLAGAKSVNDDALGDERFVLPVGAGGDWIDCWTAGAPANVDTENCTGCRDFEEGLDVVAAGGGVMMAPGCVIDRYQRNDLKYVEVTGRPRTEVRLTWRRDSPSVATRAFLDVARKYSLRGRRSRESYVADAAVRDA